MKKAIFGLLLLSVLSCKNEPKNSVSVQDIVDKSIENSGGAQYGDHTVSFMSRNKKYVSTRENGKKTLKRMTFLDSLTITDVRTNSGLTRYINDSLVNLPDSIANRYANSVNSVHYFVRLPYGLNDKAVNKQLLGEEFLNGQEYYKVKVTFDQENGGKDFDDTYVYWFNKNTLKPDYLAYDFHVDGGGQRFRAAYNERFINGIRFVDYYNYKPKEPKADILEIGQRFENNQLELLSKIELTAIEVIAN